MAHYGPLKNRYGLTPKDEQAAYGEKLRMFFETYVGDADAALALGASGKEASGEAAYVSTADKNDWDSLRAEASRWGMTDATGMPTAEYWGKVSGKPWWAAAVDGAAAGAVSSARPAAKSWFVSDSAAPAAFREKGGTGGWNLSAGGGGSAQDALAGITGKWNMPGRTHGRDLKDFITLLPYTHPGKAVIENLPYDGAEPPKMVLLSNPATEQQTNQVEPQSPSGVSPTQERDEILRALGIDPDTLSTEELDKYGPEAVAGIKQIIQDIGNAKTERELWDIASKLSLLPQEMTGLLFSSITQKNQVLQDADQQLMDTYRGYDAEGAQQAYQQARAEAAGAYGLDAKLAEAEKTYGEKMRALQEEKDALEGYPGMPGGTEAWYQSNGVRLALLNDAMKWQEDSYYRAVDAIQNGFEQYLAGQGIKEYDTSEGALLSQLTTLYAPQAGETFEVWAERVRGEFGAMLEAAVSDAAQLEWQNDMQVSNGAQNRIRQLETVLDEITYQSLFRSQGYGDALHGMAEDENLLENGYESLSGLMNDLQSARGEDAQANLDLICDPANAKYLSMYLYIFEAYGSNAARDYILHALPGMQAEAKGEEAYDPWELGTLFAEDGMHTPEEEGDGETSQEASLAFGEQRRIIEGPSLLQT